MKKLYNFRLEDNLIKQIDKLPGSRTAKIRNALQMYLQNALHDQQENVKTNDLQNDLQLQHEKQGKSVNQVNPSVQIVENYDILRHYKEEIDWLRDRVEYFESACKDLQHDARSDAKAKKETAISLYRM